MGFVKHINMLNRIGYPSIRCTMVLCPPSAIQKVDRRRPICMFFIVSQQRIGTDLPRLLFWEETTEVEAELSQQTSKAYKDGNVRRFWKGHRGN